MMRVAPKRASCSEALVAFRTRIVGVAESGTRFEDRDLLDEPTGRNAVNKCASALATAENGVVFIELAGRDVNLLGSGRVLRGGFFFFGGGVGVAAGEHQRRHGEECEK